MGMEKIGFQIRLNFIKNIHIHYLIREGNIKKLEIYISITLFLRKNKIIVSNF